MGYVGLRNYAFWIQRLAPPTSFSCSSSPVTPTPGPSKPLAPLSPSTTPLKTSPQEVANPTASFPPQSPPLDPPPPPPEPTSSDASFPKNGVLPPELFDLPAPSALFPSPSSSFRPPPELEPDPDLTSRLDARAETARRVSATPSLSTAEPEEVFAVPAIPTSRRDPAVAPAPPSRPPSRRPSLARSRAASSARNSKHASTHSSAAQYPPSPQLPDHIASLAASGSDIWGAPPALLTTASADVLIIVRDFAFERSDPRFHGEPHPDEFGSSRSSDHRSSRYSTAESPAMGNEAFASSGSSAFSWGFVTSHQTDFPGAEEDDSQVYSEDEVAGDFVPGIYSAVYDFDRELESEMTIKSGDFVTVYNRECAGWVQAARMDGVDPTGEVGLVPENYLTLVERIEPIDPNEEAVDWGSDDGTAPDGEPQAEVGSEAVVSKVAPLDTDVEVEEETEDEVSTPRPVEEE
ncbi:hypothetical protein RQP46_010838 [Phenoliferia psychrophenolica]